MSNIDLPKPKPSKLRRAVEEIKSGVKKVGQEYKAGNIPLTVPSMVKKIKNKYRKPQDIEVPESMQSVFMKAANKKFKENAPLYRNRQSAINKTKRDIKKDPSLNKMMKKLKKQKNID